MISAHTRQARPCAFCERRDSESMTTAAKSTPPVMMNWTAAGVSVSAMPEAIDWMISMPSAADQVVPRPPNRLVPPMTAAAMALSSRTPEPELWLTEVMREARNRPPIAAIVPEIASTAVCTP